LLDFVQLSILTRDDSNHDRRCERGEAVTMKIDTGIIGLDTMKEF
jgi:hypothetical protein